MANNSFEIIGTIKEIFQPMTFGSGFTKREFLVTTEDDYPQDIKFQCVQERVNQLEMLQVGERVKVVFRIRCRPWDNPTKGMQYFTDLEAYRVEQLAGDGSAVEYDSVPVEMDPFDEGSPF